MFLHNSNFYFWHDRKWVKDSTIKAHFGHLNYGSTLMLPNGKWMVFDAINTTFLASAIFDEQQGSFVEGPTIDFEEQIGLNPCVTMISNTTMGVITLGGNIYTYDLLTHEFLFVQSLPKKWTTYASWGPAASCHTLIYKGTPTGKIC